MQQVEIKMKTQRLFFIPALSIVMAMCFACFDNVNAAPARASARGVAMAARKPTATNSVKAESIDTTEEIDVDNEPEFEVFDKSSQFAGTVSDIVSSSSDDDLAEQIRKQRASIVARESADSALSAQRNALINGSNACDVGLRRCMMQTCGEDFTKCALDGDTIFGDKLNKCRKDTNCSAHEFTLLVAEIKADRDFNARMLSYDSVINCGNQYNSCIANECGATFGKCLGKSAADKAIQKCSTIAKNCTESDSGLAARFGTVIGKLRENAEIEIKADEERMYKLRDLMRDQCTALGATFDERSFDCVYTVNFFAGADQDKPMASRKRYAGDTFVCMQEWFGVNVTTYKENAYRETKAQSAASSAMLGSGVGTAAGLITSGAIGRAIDTQKAKKALDKEKDDQGITQAEEAQKDADKAAKKADKQQKKEEKQEDKKADCEERQKGILNKAGVCNCGSIAMLKNDICVDGKINRNGAKPGQEDKKAKKTGKCTQTIGSGEGTYDENGVCQITVCKGSLYESTPVDNKCVLKTTKNIQDNTADKKQKKAEEQVKREIQQMQAMKGKIKIGSVWAPNKGGAMMLIGADNPLRTQYTSLQEELAKECRKIPGYSITNSNRGVECVCNERYKPENGKCVLKKQEAQNLINSVSGIQANLRH